MRLLLCIVQRASVRVRKVPEVSVFLTIEVSVIKERSAVVNLLSKPSDMDLPVAEFVECELVVHICFNKSVSVEVEARHSDKHLEHGDVVLLNLNLHSKKILFQQREQKCGHYLLLRPSVTL